MVQNEDKAVTEYQSETTDERYTPEWVVTLIHEVLGGIDLDPTNNRFNSTKSSHYFTETTSCLINSWDVFGLPKTVYMNPPFSNSKLFVEKLLDEQKRLGFTAIACLLSGSIHNKSTQKYLAEAKAICFWHGRLNFTYPDGVKKNGNDRDIIFVLWGQDAEIKKQFDSIFGKYGLVVEPR
jgi:phage N-6-adenine-methyltransferase